MNRRGRILSFMIVVALILMTGIARAEDEHLYHASMLYGYNGTEWKKAQSDSSGNIKVMVDSGSVTATVSGVSTALNQTDGSQKTKIVDGSGNVIGATSNALDINIKSGSIANTSFASTIADGADVTLGAKADNKSTATDTTAVTLMSVLKEISYMEQNPASRAVTGTFWQTNQAVDLNAGSNVVSGQTTVTTATTRVALAGSQACLSVTVKAKPTNTGYIYVGTAAGVSSTVGFILSAKEAVTIDTDNLADIGLDSSVSGEGVSYIAVIK